MSTASNARAFTLTELLVVISVIAILASMLLPAISMVRASAKTANCASNLSQIALAMASYTNDNEGNLPAGWVSGAANISWDDLLVDYDGRQLPWTGNGNLNRNQAYLAISGVPAKSVSLFAMYTCPGDANAKRGPWIANGLDSSFWTRTYCFPGVDAAAGSDGISDVATNPGIYSVGGGAGKRDWAANLPTIPKVSQKILLAEALIVYNSLGRSSYSTIKGPSGQANNSAHTVRYDQAYGAPCQPLHRSKWNYLFCDGHVELLTGEQTSTPGSSSSTFPGVMWKRNG